MRIFMLIWLGQILSLVGSAMTRFVLAIWLWEQTGEATAMVLVGVFATVPSVAASFIAGPVIDRMSRRRLIVAADLLAGLLTVLLLILVLTERLAPWHIYLTAAFSGVFGLFHSLSFTALITGLMPKDQYTRANSMMSLAWYSSSVGAPILAGLLMAPIGVPGVMLIDIATFVFAVSVLLVLSVPEVPRDEDAKEPISLAAITFGFRYILARPPLRSLLLVIFAFTFFESFGYPLIAPMILARTGGSEVTLGLVQSTLGIGGVVGGLAVTLWGGFRRRIHGVLLGLILTGLLGDVLLGLGRGLTIWLPAAIFLELFIPLVLSSYNAIWQSKVPPAQQGRVFAARSVLATGGEPLAMLSAGLLADSLFEPAMRSGGALAAVLSALIEPGPGAGMALLLVLCGVLSAAGAVWGYLARSVRQVETLLPDHDTPVTPG